MMFETLKELAKQQPGRMALSNAESSITFEELATAAEHWRSAIEEWSPQEANDGPCGLLGLALPGGPHLTAALLGAHAATSRIAALPQQCSDLELRKFIQALPFDLLLVSNPETKDQVDRVAGPGLARLLELQNMGGIDLGPPPVSTKQLAAVPDDVWQFQFTSGSTSAPKAVGITRQAWASCLSMSRPFNQPRAAAHLFCPTPQFHAMGGALVLEHLMAGGSVHVSNRFMPGEEFKRMQRHGVKIIAANASYFRLLLSSRLLKRSMLPTLQEVVLGAEPVDGNLLDGLWSEWPELTVHLRYGLSESVGALTRLSLSRTSHYTAGMVGHALPGAEIEQTSPSAAPETAVRVRSAAVGSGYVDAAGEWVALVNDGWLSTGDQGCMDEHGLRLVGRNAWMIKRNGFRINPLEVEEVVRGLGGVADALALGVPDDERGDRLVLAIVSRVESAPEKRDVLKYCRAKMSAYKLPNDVVVWDALPTNPSGKVDRREALKRYLSAYAG